MTQHISILFVTCGVKPQRTLRFIVAALSPHGCNLLAVRDVDPKGLWGVKNPRLCWMALLLVTCSAIRERC
jgi:hypothetical protein